MLTRSLPSRLRAFVALRLDTAVEDAVVATIEKLQRPGDGIAWSRRANLHLTLRFLGDAAPQEKLVVLDRALEVVADTTLPFCVRAAGVDAFPSLTRPRVFWIGLHGASLPTLAGRVEDAARASGFLAEERRFTPHLTIGRVRHWHRSDKLRVEFDRLAEIELGRSAVESMMLYESVAARGGRVHEALAAYRFRG